MSWLILHTAHMSLLKTDVAEAEAKPRGFVLLEFPGVWNIERRIISLLNYKFDNSRCREWESFFNMINMINMDTWTDLCSHCAVMQSCSQVGGGYIDMPLLSFSIGLVGDGALAALPPCRPAVVRRLCRGIVMNNAYLIPSRGFQSHFIHTLTCVVSLVFFGFLWTVEERKAVKQNLHLFGPELQLTQKFSTRLGV